MPDDIDNLIAHLREQRERIARHMDELEASKRITESLVESVESLRNRAEKLNITGDDTMRRIAERSES